MYYWWDEIEVPGCTCEEDYCVIINRNKKGEYRWKTKGEYRWKTTRCNSSHHHLCIGDENMDCVHEKTTIPTIKSDTTIQATDSIIQTTICPEIIAPTTMLIENETESTLLKRNDLMFFICYCLDAALFLSVRN